MERSEERRGPCPGYPDIFCFFPQELQTRLSDEIGKLRSFISSRGSGDRSPHNNERSSCELEVRGCSPGCPAASIPTLCWGSPPRGGFGLERVGGGCRMEQRGQCRKEVRKLPLRCSPGALAPLPAPALLALPSFSTATLALGPAGLSKAVALESPLVFLPPPWPRCCCG